MVERIAARMGYEKRAAAPSWDALSSGMGFASAVSTRQAENLSAVLACTTVIACSLASIPALIYRREGETRTEALSHPLAKADPRGRIHCYGVARVKAEENGRTVGGIEAARKLRKESHALAAGN
ncbi:MAG TPA: hypothetical protein VF475_08080 [Sphingobium sp.]